MGRNHDPLPRHAEFIVAQGRFKRNLAAYKDMLVTVQRVRGRVAEGKDRVQQQGPRRMARLRRLLIVTRMDEGRLPDTLAPFVSGEPGFGGQCDACDGYMPPRQLMMMIPNGDCFAYVHAACYAIWLSQCRLRTALRRVG